MENTKIIDLILTKKTQQTCPRSLESTIQDDLTSAIQNLIERLRESRPLSQIG